MAIYRCEVKVIQRAKGRSATAAAAYRSASLIVDERTGEIHDYRRKAGVVETGIVMPERSGWSPSRSTLWNAAEAGEKRKDGTPAREHIIALPHELSDEQRTRLVQRYSQDLANRHNCAVDYAIHLPSEQGDDRNHHAHILRTTRQVEGEGLGAKCTVELAGRRRRDDLVLERVIWEQHCNRALAEAGCADRVDHRSHADRGTGQEPQPKLGPAATAMKRRNEHSDRAEEVEDVAWRNRQRDELNQAITTAEREAGQLHDELEQLEKEKRDAAADDARRRGRAHGIEPLGAESGGEDRRVQPAHRPGVISSVPVPGMGGGGAKKKPQKPQGQKKDKDKQQTEREVSAYFKQFADSLRGLGGQLLKGLQRQSEKPERQAAPAAPAQAQRPPPRSTKPPVAAPTAAAPDPLEQYIAKTLEIDARFQARASDFKNPTGLQKLARAAYQEPNAQQNAQLQRRLGERAAEMAQRIRGGDAAALGEFRAAAGRLQQHDVLALANSEKQHAKRTRTQGIDFSLDRLAQAAAGDLKGLSAALGHPAPAGTTVADHARAIGDALPTKRGPRDIKGMKPK